MDLLKYNRHWEKGFIYNYPIHRNAFDDIVKLLSLRQIIAITGLRRTGKSVLMYQTINYLLQERNVDRFKVLYFSFDYERLSIEQLLQEYQKQVNIELSSEKQIFVFLDEIQKLNDFQEQIKLFYDLYPNVKFIISGSSSLFISKKVRESLAGRVFDVFLKPLSFKEYLKFVDGSYLLEKPSLYKNKIEIEFARFLKKQFIETINFTDEQTQFYLDSIINKIIYEDIPQIFPIDNPSVLKKILNLLAQYPGMLVNYSSLANELRLSNKTVSSYFEILENSFLIKMFRNFSRNLSTSDRKSKKAYLSAASFALSLNNFLSDGLAVENYFASQTQANFFWRDSYNHEVDFVYVDNNMLVAYEIKYKDNLKSDDYKNLAIFYNKFKPDELNVITKILYSKTIVFRQIEVNLKPVYD